MKETVRPQYITQLNAFHRWLSANYLPPTARLLWFMLIGLFNSGGWPQQIQIDTLHLMVLVGTQSDKTAIRARQSLIDAGLLEYERGCKAQPGRYRLVWFAEGGTAECRAVNPAESDGENDSQNEEETDFHSDSENESENASENDGEYDGENDGDATAETTVQHTLYARKDKEIYEKRQNETVIPAELAPVFGAYVEMCEKMRKPMTESAKGLVLFSLQALAPNRPQEQRQILEQSIRNGWTGVYALKTEQAPEPPASVDAGEFERRLL